MYIHTNRTSRIKEYNTWNEGLDGLNSKSEQEKNQQTWKYVHWDYSVWGREWKMSEEKWTEPQRSVGYYQTY